MRPWEQWITEVEVIEQHAQGIRRHGGGDESPPKHGCLDQSLAGAYNAALYSCEDEADYMLTFCGYLLFYLSSNHCFENGNKRVAWLSCTHVLLNEGLTIEASDGEAIALGLQIATHEIADGSHVVTWIADRLVSVS